MGVVQSLIATWRRLGEAPSNHPWMICGARQATQRQLHPRQGLTNGKFTVNLERTK